MAGLVTAVLVLGWTRSQEQLSSVLVAVDGIRAGAVFEETDVVAVDVPAGSVFSGVLVAATDRDALVGAVAVRSIAPGEPVLYSDLRDPVGPPGRRAMSLPIRATFAVGGELMAGDRVDVLAATEDRVRFVAEQVPVLAVPDTDSGLVAGAADGWVVLAVEDREALAIAAAVESATVYLLRSTGTDTLTVWELPGALPGAPISAVSVAAGG